MVAYQKEKVAVSTPYLYTVVSSDYGATWVNQSWISTDGAHPDIAYGRGGFAYLVYGKTASGDYEINFFRNPNYCYPGEWQDLESITSDTYDDDYPTVAALYTLPDSTPYVWVAYNHDFANSGNWDLRYAYSSNGGKDWSKNHYLASASDYDERASDLWVGRNQSFQYVNVCYLKSRYVTPKDQDYDIYWGYANTGGPASWSISKISNYWGASDYNGRKVCQGSYGNLTQYWSGVMYAGRSLFTNYSNLYFDNREWTDVEDGNLENLDVSGFSLSDNYPNPFNPDTRISYFIALPCHVRLEIFNVLGQKIRTLVDEEQGEGTNQVVWDGRNQMGNEVASGVYFYKLKAGDFGQTKKMVLVR
jgi:hypothetical protein